MMQLVRQRDELHNAKRLLKTIKGIGDKTALTSIAAVPELCLISNKAAAALIGVAPFLRRSGTMIAPARIHGGRAPVRNAFYIAAVTASRTIPSLPPSTPTSSQQKATKSLSSRDAPLRRLR